MGIRKRKQMAAAPISNPNPSRLPEYILGTPGKTTIYFNKGILHFSSFRLKLFFKLFLCRFVKVICLIKLYGGKIWYQLRSSFNTINLYFLRKP